MSLGTRLPRSWHLPLLLQEVATISNDVIRVPSLCEIRFFQLETQIVFSDLSSSRCCMALICLCFITLRRRIPSNSLRNPIIWRWNGIRALASVCSRFVRVCRDPSISDVNCSYDRKYTRFSGVWSLEKRDYNTHTRVWPNPQVTRIQIAVSRTAAGVRYGFAPTQDTVIDGPVNPIRASLTDWLLWANFSAPL